jgi:hypothetical protein
VRQRAQRSRRRAMNSEWMSCLRLLADKNSSTKRKARPQPQLRS